MRIARCSASERAPLPLMLSFEADLSSYARKDMGIVFTYLLIFNGVGLRDWKLIEFKTKGRKRVYRGQSSLDNTSIIRFSMNTGYLPIVTGKQWCFNIFLLLFIVGACFFLNLKFICYVDSASRKCSLNVIILNRAQLHILNTLI